MWISLALLTILLSECCGNNVKTWIPNTNFWNKDNWSAKRTPCRTDRVIFPPMDNANAVVFLRPGTTAFREIILPENGELILPEGQLLVTGNKPGSSIGCPGEDIVFSGGSERLWVDWRNWRSDLIPKSGGEDISPVPHLERLPCATDQIIFPDSTTFKVRLPEAPVTVGSLSMQGMSIGGEEFKHIISGDTGYNMFLGSELGGVEVTGDTCEDPLGCVCRHQDEEIVDVTCLYQKQFCEVPLCEHPVTPQLHCCSFCGAVMQLYLDGSKRVSLETIRRKVSAYGGIMFHLSRTDVDKMQLVLRERGGKYSGESARVAKQLQQDLLNDRSVGELFDVAIAVSGEPITALGSTSSIVLVIIFTLVIACVLAALAFFGYHRYRGGYIPTEMPSFHFRRFENASTPGEGEVEIARAARESPAGKSFDNPMFDQPASTSGGGFVVPRSVGRSVTMENPTFKALQAAVAQHEENIAEVQENEDDVTFGSAKYHALKDEE